MQRRIPRYWRLLSMPRGLLAAHQPGLQTESAESQGTKEERALALFHLRGAGLHDSAHLYQSLAKQ